MFDRVFLLTYIQSNSFLPIFSLTAVKITFLRNPGNLIIGTFFVYGYLFKFYKISSKFNHDFTLTIISCYL